MGARRHGSSSHDDLPRSPTGRVPKWVLDEALGREPEPAGWRQAPTTLRERPRAPRGRVLAGVTVVVVLAVGGWAVASGWLPAPSPTGAASDPGASSGPTPGREVAAAPLGAPEAVTGAASGSYRFVSTQSDGVTALAYDPCRPVHYVMNTRNAPAGSAELLAVAVARVSTATGLQFVYDGTTDEAPSSSRSAFQPDRYGDRWAPVLVAWSTPTQQPDFVGDVVGQAGSVSMSASGSPQVFVTGTVELDAVWFAKQLRRDPSSTAPRSVLLHELGHLVGLDHVSDPRQVMYAEQRPDVVDYAAGGLAGLAALGSGACVPQL